MRYTYNNVAPHTEPIEDVTHYQSNTPYSAGPRSTVAATLNTRIDTPLDARAAFVPMSGDFQRCVLDLRACCINICGTHPATFLASQFTIAARPHRIQNHLFS